MNSLATIIYETGALVGVVVFIVGTLKTLLDDNANVDACKKTESITRKKRFLLKSNSTNESTAEIAKPIVRHKASMEHYTIEKMYSKNISLLQSEKAETEIVEKRNDAHQNTKSFLSDVLDSLESTSTVFELDVSDVAQVSQEIQTECNRISNDSNEPADHFLDLIKEQKAYFSQQNLQHLSSSMLKLFNNITWLDLSYNQLIALPEEFGNLETLIHLNLKENLIEILPKSFKNLVQLNSLDLSFNNLSTLGMRFYTDSLDDLVFEGMVSLKSVNLSSNRFTNIPLSIGFRYKSLCSFSIDNNPLDSDNFTLWRQITQIGYSRLGSGSKDSHRPSRSSFDDYLSSRIPGSSPTGFKIARKVHEGSTDMFMTQTRSQNDSENSNPLAQRLLILRDVFDLYKAKTEKPEIDAISKPYKNLKTPSLSKRNKIIAEIISTEETYVTQLEILMNIYVRPLRALDIIPKEAYECLFSNVEGIYLLHKMKFLPKMSQNPEAIGGVLLGLLPFLKSYETYCTNFDRANEVLTEIEKQDGSKINSKFLSKSSIKRFSHFLKLSKSHPQHTQLNLQSYLILPIQRLPRYRLLLAELLDSSSINHPDFLPLSNAKEVIDQQIMRLNERKRLQQDMQDIQEALNKIAIHSDSLKEAMRKINKNAGKFIHKGEIKAVSLVQRLSPYSPLLDISRACEKDRYTQRELMGVMESLFGVSPNKARIEEGFHIPGKLFYFFKFKNLLIWCRSRADNSGRNEYLAAITIEKEEIIEFSDASSFLRINGDGCILYLEASMAELKKWRHWL